MNYRIVEWDRTADLSAAVEIGKYDSAYRAMDAMKRAFVAAESSRWPDWYLLDTAGQILARPDDVIDSLG